MNLDSIKNRIGSFLSSDKHFPVIVDFSNQEELSEFVEYFNVGNTEIVPAEKYCEKDECLKIEELTKFKKKIVQEIDDTINNISAGYVYCEKCGKWYKNRAWEVKAIKEPRKVLSATFCMTEEPDIVYAEKDIIVWRLECPVGHLQPYQSLNI